MILFWKCPERPLTVSIRKFVVTTYLTLFSTITNVYILHNHGGNICLLLKDEDWLLFFSVYFLLIYAVDHVVLVFFYFTQSIMWFIFFYFTQTIMWFIFFYFTQSIMWFIFFYFTQTIMWVIFFYFTQSILWFLFSSTLHSQSLFYRIMSL